MRHGPYFGDGGGHHDPHVLGLIFCFVVVALVIAGIVWLVLRLTGRSHAYRGPAAATAGDSAIETLRMRYARGEIDREAFARASADLGHPLPQ